MHLQQRILVTGGSGFLGSHLCERLLLNGAEVICLDNFFTGARRNIEQLLGNKRFELIRHDVTFPIYLEIDQIYNLACPASPIHYQHDPVQTTKTSVHGAINMLGLAKRVKAKILQASTSEVYGDPNVHPQTEEYWGHVNPIGIRSCYDEGKRCAETLFFDYWRQNKLRIKVARIFNTYGPRMHPNDGRVVSNFISSGAVGAGHYYLRRWLADALFLLCRRSHRWAHSSHGFAGFNCRPYKYRKSQMNFRCCNLRTTILDLTGSRSQIVHRPLPQDDPRQRQPNITKAHDLLGWKPMTPLKEGLIKTVAYFENLLREPGIVQLLGSGLTI